MDIITIIINNNITIGENIDLKTIRTLLLRNM